MCILYCSFDRNPQKKKFLPGYELYNCLGIFDTFDGKPNLDGYIKEFLVDKVELLHRVSRNIRVVTEWLNDKLYYTYIPRHVLLGFNGLQAVRSICVKLALRYTDFQPSPDAIEAAERNSLNCIRQTRLALRHIDYCVVYNPRENIKPSSMDFMYRLLNRGRLVIERYHCWLVEINENVQAE